MIRVVIGSFAGAVAMFIVAFIFWATPLRALGYSYADDTQGANIQAVLAQNLSSGGRYMIPSPNSAAGAVLYGKGPVATVDFSTGGYSTQDPAVLIGGFVQEFVVVLMIGLTLLAVAGRVTDFSSRARLVIGFSAAATVLLTLSDPIWMHSDWRFAIYNLIACTAMLCAGGLVVAKWFLPTPVKVSLH
jgi:hypothetical protein